MVKPLTGKGLNSTWFVSSVRRERMVPCDVSCQTFCEHSLYLRKQVTYRYCTVVTLSIYKFCDIALSETFRGLDEMRPRNNQY